MSSNLSDSRIAYSKLSKRGLQNTTNADIKIQRRFQFQMRGQCRNANVGRVKNVVLPERVIVPFAHPPRGTHNWNEEFEKISARIKSLLGVLVPWERSNFVSLVTTYSAIEYKLVHISNQKYSISPQSTLVIVSFHFCLISGWNTRAPDARVQSELVQEWPTLSTEHRYNLEQNKELFNFKSWPANESCGEERFNKQHREIRNSFENWSQQRPSATVMYRTGICINHHF